MTEDKDWQREDAATEPPTPEQEGEESGETDVDESSDAPAVTEQKSSISRVLLLVLLLIVLGAAGLYYYSGLLQPEKEQLETASLEKQPIAIPKPPPPPPPKAAEPTAAQEPQASLPAKGILREMAIDESPPVPSEPEQGAVVGSESATPLPETTVSSAPVAAVGDLGDAGDTPAGTEPSAEAPVAEAPPTEETQKLEALFTEKAEGIVVSSGNYMLNAGAFLVKANLAEASDKVRQLGFEPRVSPVKKTVEMTRLRVGAYPPAEGKAKLAELRKATPDAFSLLRKGKMVLYAASYRSLDKARAHADRLFEKGIRVEEEPASVKIGFSDLSFGDFPDRAAAEKAAKTARAAGLDVKVVKKP